MEVGHKEEVGTKVVTTVDYHTAGEPFRIVTGGASPVTGATVRERREVAKTGEANEIRQLLCNEPRGHADMYGCFLVPPDDDGAHLGALFWHKDGFSTACGHGTIALGRYAIESGLVDLDQNGRAVVVIDVPSGRVEAIVQALDGSPHTVTFRNVPAFVLARGLVVTTSLGPVAVDISYGGAIYASVEAEALGFAIEPRALPDLIALAREIKESLAGNAACTHPDDDRLSGIYGVIWHEDVSDEPRRPLIQRNCTVFADGEVDRSPCGSGTSARMALLAADGRLDPSRPLLHESVIGSTFVGRIVVSPTRSQDAPIVTEIEGCAYRTGEHRFVLERSDPLGWGFQLR